MGLLCGTQMAQARQAQPIGLALVQVVAFGVTVLRRTTFDELAFTYLCEVHERRPEVFFLLLLLLITRLYIWTNGLETADF